MTRERIINRTPVERLYDDDGDINAHRERYVSTDDLEAILKKYPVEFYVADLGTPLRRIAAERCYDFWKSEVKSHLAPEPDEGFCLEDFPGEYAYVASEWTGEIQTPIILREKHH